MRSTVYAGNVFFLSVFRITEAKGAEWTFAAILM